MHEGLTAGFRIGFNHLKSHLHPRRINHPSALAKQKVVQDGITMKVAAGRLLGPLPLDLAQCIHVSPLGLVPKAHESNKWRLIVDLSRPTGCSDNDGISRDLWSLHYTSVDEAVGIIRKLGRETELVKLDIKDTYHIVPVHPVDYHLLGICWEENTYIDRALPFGLRSAPKLFNAVADFITWVLSCQGVKYQLHYLDDFLLLGAPGSQEAVRSLTAALETFNQESIPVAAQKTEGPSTVLAFLGILIDTHTLENSWNPCWAICPTQQQSLNNIRHF